MVATYVRGAGAASSNNYRFLKPHAPRGSRVAQPVRHFFVRAWQSYPSSDEAGWTPGGTGSPKKTRLSPERIEELLSRFRQDLENPDHTLVTTKHCKRRFGLSWEQLEELASVAKVSQVSKENPYGADNRGFQQYWLPDVVRVAKEVHGANVLVERYRKYLESGQREEETYRKVFGWSELRKQLERGEQDQDRKQGKNRNPKTGLSALLSVKGSIGKQPLGLKSVKQSFFTNLGIFGTKLSVWILTGSAAMFADCMHSFADVCNATYRYYGIHMSQATPTAKHPYGQERRRFVFADRSASGVLVLGGILPLIHGLHEFNTPHELLLPGATIAVFCVSAFLESLQVKKAYAEIQAQAKEKDMSVLQYLKGGSEMMSISTFTEAGIGIVGSSIGIIGVLAAWSTGVVMYDNLSGIMIAGSVCCAAGFLLRKNEEQLVGCTLPIDLVVRITERILEEKVVTSVHDIKTEVYGVTAVRYKAEIQFNAEAITRRYSEVQTVPSPEAEQMTQDFRRLTEGAPTEQQAQEQVEDFVMRNNALFLANLCMEVRRVEKIVKTELQSAGYSGIHIDLEPY